MSRMKCLQGGWDGMGYILFNHVLGIASNVIKIIGANTGMMEMMTWKGEI